MICVLCGIFIYTDFTCVECMSLELKAKISQSSITTTEQSSDTTTAPPETSSSSDDTG